MRGRPLIDDPKPQTPPPTELTPLVQHPFAPDAPPEAVVGLEAYGPYQPPTTGAEPTAEILPARPVAARLVTPEPAVETVVTEQPKKTRLLTALLNYILHYQPETRCQAATYCLCCIGVLGGCTFGGCELLGCCCSYHFSMEVSLPVGAGIGAFFASSNACGFFCCPCVHPHKEKGLTGEPNKKGPAGPSYGSI